MILLLFSFQPSWLTKPVLRLQISFNRLSYGTEIHKCYFLFIDKTTLRLNLTLQPEMGNE